MSSDLPSQSRFTWKRLTAVGPCVLLILLGLWWWFGQNSLSRQLAELRSQGLPTNAEELNKYYAVPAGVADTTDLWVAAIDAVMAADLFQNGNSLPIVGANPADIPPPGEPWPDLESARSYLQSLERELQLIWKAAEAGGQARFPVQFSPGKIGSPLLLNSRQPARLLKLHAHVSAHDGQDAAVITDVLASFALSEAVRGEPVLISFLVRIALQGISCDLVQDLAPHCQWSDADLAALQSMMRKADFKGELVRVLHGERALTLSGIDNAGHGPLSGPQKKAFFQMMQQAIEGLEQDWPTALKEQQKMAAGMTSGGLFARWKDTFAKLSFPGVEQATAAAFRAEARQRAMIAMLAVRRFQLRHGRLPDSLREIEPELFGPGEVSAELLTDPFDSQPLRFHRENSRVLIYSIGFNGQDDGGQLTAKKNNQYPEDMGFEIEWK